MLDGNGKRVVVSTDGDVGPYILSDPKKTDKIRKELKKHGIRSSRTRTLNGGQATLDVIDLDDATVENVQDILDGME